MQDKQSHTCDTYNCTYTKTNHEEGYNTNWPYAANSTETEKSNKFCSRANKSKTQLPFDLAKTVQSLIVLFNYIFIIFRHNFIKKIIYTSFHFKPI